MARAVVLLGVGLLGGSPRAAGPELTWLWANPQAHGNNLYDMAYQDGLTVQVGDRGQLYTSIDGGLWVPWETGTAKSLRSLCFFRDRVIATGEAGTVVTGDLASLTNLNTTVPLSLVDLGTSDWLEGVAASGSVAVAVGDNGAVYTSADAAAWTRRPQTFGDWLRAVAYGPGLFVAVGEGGFVATSANGAAWEERKSGTTVNLNRVAWIGTRFYAVGDRGRVLTSPNGVSWSAFPQASGTTNDLYFVAGTTASGFLANLLVGGASELRLFEGGWTDETSPSKSLPAPRWSYFCGFWDGLYYVTGGSAGMLVEGFKTNFLSGFSWVNQSDSLRSWLWDVARVGDLYVATGDLGTIQTSGDGIAWNLEVVPGSATNAVLLGAGGRPGLLVTVGTRGTILTSSNGIYWTAVSPPPVANDLQGVAVLGSEVFVSGGAGTILSSPDGDHWTLRATLTSSFLSGLAASPQALVAVGEGGAIFTSPNGAQWSVQQAHTTNWLARVRYLAGRWIAVGESGTILTSSDGTNWLGQVSGTTAWLNDAAHFNGYFYVVGNQGTLLASPDAMHWTRLPIVTQKSLSAAATDPRQLLTVGIEGVILRGQPGPLAFREYQRIGNTNLFGLSGLPGRRFVIDRSAPLTSWSPLLTAQFLDNSGAVVVGEARTNNPPAQEAYRGRLSP